MSALDGAINQLASEVADLSPTKQTPEWIGSTAWWIQQGKSIGLSHLRYLKAQGITDPQIANEVRKSYLKELKPDSPQP